MKTGAGIASLLVIAGCHSALVSSGFDAPDAFELASKNGFTWSADTSGRLIVHTESTARNIDTERVVRALAYVDSVLQMIPDNRIINVFAVSSPDRMKALLGRQVDGRSFYQTGVAAIVANDNWEATARHELSHVVAGQHWGKASSEWISEGVATWIGNPFYGRDIRILTRDRLIKTGRALPIRTLYDPFLSAPDEVLYLQSASVAQFVAERFGIAVLRDLWQNGIGAVNRSTGFSVDDFEREWRGYVSR